ncbi:MAG TPA: biopolymer transporter ExbD [Pyrinomonadaceae bacterium]|nr:biopolymer transporter ExbD [Pyrinomonadaceae bacterium]
MKRIKDSTPPPFINVTPLIDVLLVMLIIFMVAVPLNPSRFEAKLPSPPNNDPNVVANPNTLVVSIDLDRTIKLNREVDMGTVDDMSKLTKRLVSVFDLRTRNHSYRADMINRFDLPENVRIEKTVFIKAPRTLPYGEVARVMDGLKGTGASPIGLQLDDLK